MASIENRIIDAAARLGKDRYSYPGYKALIREKARQDRREDSRSEYEQGQRDIVLGTLAGGGSLGVAPTVTDLEVLP